MPQRTQTRAFDTTWCGAGKHGRLCEMFEVLKHQGEGYRIICPTFSQYTLEKTGMRTAELLGCVDHGAALGVPYDPRVARGRAHKGRVEARQGKTKAAFAIKAMPESFRRLGLFRAMFVISGGK